MNPEEWAKDQRRKIAELDSILLALFSLYREVNRTKDEIRKDLENNHDVRTDLR